MVRDNAALLLVALVACSSGPKGPTLRAIVVSEEIYASPTGCAQGPFDVVVPTEGGRWGESLAVRVASPRRVRLHATAAVDDQERDRRVASLGPGEGDRPENDRCVAGAVELDSTTTPPSPTTIPPGPSPPLHPVGFEPPATTPATPPPGLALVPRPPGDLPGSAEELIDISWSNRDPEAPPPIRAGASIRIRIWASVPNDLSDVAFVVVRMVNQPTIPEADWIAYLRAERDRQRSAAEASAERERQRLANAPPPAPPRLVDPAAAERRDAEAQARREREDQARADRELRQAADEERRVERERARVAWCEGHRGDTSCWGPGGYAIHLDLERRRAERVEYCAGHLEDARCWSTEEWHRRRVIVSGRVEAAYQAAHPREPSGPPPAPRVEVQPPRASVNAEWRPGYYRWDGASWQWVVGLWRVPEADIVAGLTVRAPSAPPVLKVEAPPAPPASGSVWVPGSWSWDGKAWIWLGGAWQAPPAADVEWQPQRWEPKGTGVILVPGGWINITVGR